MSNLERFLNFYFSVQVPTWSIQIGNKNLHDSIPSDVGKLTSLTRLKLQNNILSGPLPSPLQPRNLTASSSKNFLEFCGFSSFWELGFIDFTVFVQMVEEQLEMERERVAQLVKEEEEAKRCGSISVLFVFLRSILCTL